VKSTAAYFAAKPDECLWQAYTSLHNTVDPLVCLDFVLVLLFLRTLETRNGEHAPEASSRPHPQGRLTVPADSAFNLLYTHRKTEGLGQRIDSALAALEAANSSRLASVFTELRFAEWGTTITKARERDRCLGQVLEHLHGLRAGEPQLGHAADRLRARVAAVIGKVGVEVFTPGTVSDLVAALLNPVPGEHLCDPLCGAGDVLVALARAGGGTALYGQETDPAAHRRGRLNLLLHGFDNAQLQQGEVLSNPHWREGSGLRQFDVVAARLPFTAGLWGEGRAHEDPFGRFWRGVPPATKRDYAFIAHVLETTREGHGRAAVVVTRGALYRGGSEGRIRRRLIEDNLLDAVIGLPGDVFPDNAGPTAILLFRKNRQTTDVLFMEATAQEGVYPLGTAQREELVAAYRRYETEALKVRRVSVETIEQNGFNLNLPRYLDAQPAEEAVDVLPTLQAIERLEAEQADLTARFKAQLRFMGIYTDQ
jgi:type I restriction enzyme M protein